jgi:hypothetical protein
LACFPEGRWLRPRPSGRSLEAGAGLARGLYGEGGGINRPGTSAKVGRGCSRKPLRKSRGDAPCRRLKALEKTKGSRGLHPDRSEVARS